ncbi:hypothetical protein Tco_0115231 [Tanacetum coccineum]
MGVTQNNLYGQIGGTHDLNVPPALMAKVHSHALNVLERNLSMKYSVLGQSILRIEYNNQMVQSELSGNMVNTDERRGVKRPFLEQINLHNQNAMDSLQMYQDLLLLEARDHALNVLRRNPLINISVLGQSILKNEYNRQMSRKEPSGNMVNIDEKRGVKKSSLEQINPRILNATDTLQMYQELLFEARDHALNVLARNLRMKISDFGQSILRNEYSNQMGRNEPSGHMVDIDEGRGVQRPSLEEIDPRNLNDVDSFDMNSLQLYQELFLGDDNRADRYNDLASIMEIQKKMRAHKHLQGDYMRGDNWNAMLLGDDDRADRDNELTHVMESQKKTRVHKDLQGDNSRGVQLRAMDSLQMYQQLLLSDDNRADR